VFVSLVNWDKCNGCIEKSGSALEIILSPPQMPQTMTKKIERVKDRKRGSREERSGLRHYGSMKLIFLLSPKPYHFLWLLRR
jgi:hypothetical protein